MRLAIRQRAFRLAAASTPAGAARASLRVACPLVVAAILVSGLGCTYRRQQQSLPATVPTTAIPLTSLAPAQVVPVSHQQEEAPPPPTSRPAATIREALPPAPALPAETLSDLEFLALENNPTLRRMQQEAAAEWDRTGYVARLPDPTIQTMFFGDSMHMVPDRQLAEVQLMQMIPWIGRLKAEAQQAHMEALAAENLYLSERATVIGELRAAWYKLYVLGKQIETTEADKAQLQSLINTANARIATGSAQPGDVLMATLELSSLQEQLLTYRQQIASTTAELNRLVGRGSAVPIVPPHSIDASLPQWDHDLLNQIAMETQPDLAAARLRTAATAWGIEVARLKRRPDLTFGAGWMVMAADPADTMPGAGDDAWTLGVTASVPLWRRKYDAILSEASRQHDAAHASEEEVTLRIDALLRDLWEQALAGQKTVELYETTILPQARQTFEADQKSLINNTVTFDRVVRGYRTLLSLELGYHRALGQLATTLARIRQAVGVDLLPTPEPAAP